MALNLFGRLMPVEESFTVLFCEQATCILEAAHGLRTMIVEDVDIDAHVASIREIEMRADVAARKVFLAANRTFNAPIDREDILQLAHELDDAVDLIEDTAKGIARYEVHAMPEEMHAMAHAIVDSAERLRKVMPYLDSVTRDHKQIFALCEEIGHIEGRADEAFDQGLTKLRAKLRAGEIDTIGYIDRKELYELLEQVVDKCDDIANAVQSITTKHV
jgi:predicted phosphate transport protein (TIGR00153 family)